MKVNTTKTRLSQVFGIVLGGLVLPLAAVAQDSKSSDVLDEYSNNSYLSLTGKVESVAPNAFVLSYDDGNKVTVEMDDGDRDADAYKLLPGDEVTVYGVMDQDLFETQKIEASSVYVEKLNTFFQASAVDEEDYYPMLTIVSIGANDGSSGNSKSSGSSNAKTGSAGGSSTAQAMTPEPVLWVQGKVTGVQDDSFKLAMDGKNIDVRVDELSDNPLDDEGYRKIENGDVVSVLGTIDGSFFDNAQLAADSVVKIHDRAKLN